jgi:hypothetical protein
MQLEVNRFFAFLAKQSGAPAGHPDNLESSALHKLVFHFAPETAARLSSNAKPTVGGSGISTEDIAPRVEDYIRAIELYYAWIIRAFKCLLKEQERLHQR